MDNNSDLHCRSLRVCAYAVPLVSLIHQFFAFHAVPLVSRIHQFFAFPFKENNKEGSSFLQEHFKGKIYVLTLDTRVLHNPQVSQQEAITLFRMGRLYMITFCMTI
jgi:hypothetical protein